MLQKKQRETCNSGQVFLQLSVDLESLHADCAIDYVGAAVVARGGMQEQDEEEEKRRIYY